MCSGNTVSVFVVYTAICRSGIQNLVRGFLKKLTVCENASQPHCSVCAICNLHSVDNVFSEIHVCVSDDN